MIKLGKYQHYKGQTYNVIGFAHDTETRSALVLYRPLYPVPELEKKYNNDVIFARPLTMFSEKVTINGKQTDRFTFIDPQP